MVKKLIKNTILTIIFITLMVFVVQFFSQAEKEEPLINNTIMEKQVEIEILKEGEGELSKKGDTLVVHYVGKLESGEKFDSSLDRGVPFEFTLGANSVIQGWEQGMLNMKVGEKRILNIPYELGYGEAGYYPVIPAKTNLIFEVELLEIK